MKPAVQPRLSLDRFADRLADVMPRFTQVVLREERNLLASGLVTVPQLWAMLHLDAEGPCPMTSLARALRLSPPTATSLVDRLVAMQLIQRRAQAGDRRVIQVDMTPRGRRLLAQFKADRRQSAHRHFAAIPTRDRLTFLAVLEKLVKQDASGAAGAQAAGKTRKRS